MTTPYSQDLNDTLVLELNQRFRHNEEAARIARRGITLATGAVAQFEPGSAYAIAEQAMLEAMERVAAAEEANAETFRKACDAIDALKPPTPAARTADDFEEYDTPGRDGDR